jgi:beta-lactamase class A
MLGACARDKRAIVPTIGEDERQEEQTAPASSTTTSAEKESTESANSEAIARIERELGGRVGVFAYLPKRDWTLAHRADERFAMCSTFKWALAAAILQRVEAGQLSLEQPLPFGQGDLLEWAPVTRAQLQAQTEASLSIAELCHAAITVSDNTAANLLLQQIDGPPGLTTFFREMGDEVSRLDRSEPMLNMNTAGDPQDTTSPRAMAQLLHTVLSTDALNLSSRQTLTEWLIQTETGAARLKAGLPEGTKLGHKTGGGNRGAVNDVGVFWLASGEPCYIASYLSGSDKPMSVLEAAHAQIARVVVEGLT